MKIDEIEVNSTSELLRILDSAELKWKGWIFRGQSNNTHKLIPSAWRGTISELYNEFKSNLDLTAIEKRVMELQHVKEIEDEKIFKNVFDWLLYTKFENYLLRSFYKEANNSGLRSYPYGTPNYGNIGMNFYSVNQTEEENLKSILHSIKINRFSYQSPINFSLEIPQHHGLPTRTLDWTTHPRKAAFFASYGFIKDYENKNNFPEKIAICALKVITQSVHSKVLLDKSTSRFDNPFLHHQDGLFTEIKGDIFYLKNGYWPSIEDLYADEKEETAEFILNKYYISSSHVYEILQRLNNDRICLSTLMPDYHHVAKKVMLSMKIKHKLK